MKMDAVSSSETLESYLPNYMAS